MRESGLVVDFDQDCIHCKHLSVPMEPSCKRQDDDDVNFITNIQEPQSAVEAVKRVKQILDTKCRPVSSQKIIDNSPHLTD